MNLNVHELQRRTTLFIQSMFVYTAHKVNVVAMSTNGEYGLRFVYTAHKVNVVVMSTNSEYGLRYWVEFLGFTP